MPAGWVVTKLAPRLFAGLLLTLVVPLVVLMMTRVLRSGPGPMPEIRLIRNVRVAPRLKRKASVSLVRSILPRRRVPAGRVAEVEALRSSRL